MPHFSTAPVDEVAPKRKTRGPSPRSVLQQEYRFGWLSREKYASTHRTRI